MCKRGSTTIAQIRAAIEASPQSLNCKTGEYGEIDFRLDPDTEVLEESFVITAATLLYAKKKVLKNKKDKGEGGYFYTTPGAG